MDKAGQLCRTLPDLQLFWDCRSACAPQRLTQYWIRVFSHAIFAACLSAGARNLCCWQRWEQL